MMNFSNILMPPWCLFLQIMLCVILISFVDGSQAIIAQKVTFSDPIDIFNDDAYHILGEYDDHILLFMDTRREFVINAYNKNMHIDWRKTLDIDVSEYNVVGVLGGSSFFHIFLSKIRRDSSFLFHIKYDSKAQFVDEKIVDASQNNKRFGTYLFTQSEDNKQAVFLQTDRQQNVRMISYNIPSLDVRYVEEVIFEDNISGDFRILDINNKGDIVLVLDRYNSKFYTRKHRVDIVYTKGTAATEVLEIPFPDILFSEIDAVFDNKNNLFQLITLYSEDSFSRSDGYILTTISLNKGVYKKVVTKWSMNLLDEVNDSGKRRSSTDIRDLSITDVGVYEKGGIMFLAEQQRVMSRRNTFGTVPSYNSVGEYIDYYYEDIIMASYEAENQISWVRSIQKKQFSQDDNASYSSYFVFKVPSYIQVIFNDEISNNSIVSGFYVNGNGQMKRTSVLSTDFQNLKLRMKNAVQLSSTSFIIPSEYKSNLKLVYVKY